MMPGIKHSLAKSVTRCRLQSSLLLLPRDSKPRLKKKTSTFISGKNWTEVELPQGIVCCVALVCVCSFVVGTACRGNDCFPSAGQQVCPGVWASSLPAGKVGFRAMPLPSTHLSGKCCVNVVRRFWQWYFKTHLSPAGFSYWVDRLKVLQYTWVKRHKPCV